MRKTAQEKIWAKFCDEIISKPKIPVTKRKFKAHPAKVHSDSDVSSCMSPRFYPEFSSESDVEFFATKVRMFLKVVNKCLKLKTSLQLINQIIINTFTCLLGNK